MRKLFVSFVAAGVLLVIGAAPAAAEGPFIQSVNPAACNQGTQNAHGNVAGPAHPHVPHMMRPAPGEPPECMTMPGVNPGQP